MQYSQTHSLFCFPYSSGKGEKYQASISYLPNWILSTYFILVIFRRHKNQTNKTGALINLCCILESYSLFNLFSAVENFMCWSLKELSKGFCMAKRFCLKLCPFNYLWYWVYKTTLVSGNTLTKILRALNYQSCKRPLFDLLQHRKLQKLRSSFLITHYTQQEIVCIPKLCDI